MIKSIFVLVFSIILFTGCSDKIQGYNLEPIYYSDKTLKIMDLEFNDTNRGKFIIKNLDYKGRTGKVYSTVQEFNTKDKTCRYIYSNHNQAKDGYTFKTDFYENLEKKYKGNCIKETVSNIDFVWCAVDKKSEYRVISSELNDEGFTKSTSLIVSSKCFNKIQNFVIEQEKIRKQNEDS